MAARLPDPGAWRGRRVLLTGHTGFKGAWLALWLRQLGAEVTGFALPPATDPALATLAGIDRAIDSVLGDLRDQAAVTAAVDRARPEIVLHLAAQPIVRRALADPVETFASNVMGSVHLLQALRRAPDLRAILVVTSDKVYANSDDGRAHAEAAPLGGRDPYSASKAATELVVRSFAASYFAVAGVRVATARGGNVIGGGDYAQDRIVADIVRAATRGEPPVLRMPGATRPWQHVLDALCGYLLYAEDLMAGRERPPSLNFGPAPSSPITVAEIAAALLQALGRNADCALQPESASLEMSHLAIDSSLARQSLGWGDRLNGADLIGWTGDWYRRIAAGEDASGVTLAQIAAYGALP